MGEASFPIVGIGASSRGIDALKQFFGALPDETGMAFVVVFHLDPGKENHLAGVLQKRTALPVTVVTEAVPVEPDRVYVVPPGKDLALIDSRLRPLESVPSPATWTITDRFFRTLAEAQGRKAVGVVLSGTGSDGALGLEEIKGRGGLTVVQSPLEAEYDGMPQAAAATGRVDLTLPVAEIPEAVLRFARTEPRVAVPEADDATSDRRAEEALHASETRYRALFNAMDEGACLFERLPLRPDGLRDYRYLAMNPAMQAMFGIPDLSGQSIRDNFPDEAEAWYDDYDRVLETGEPIRLVRESDPQGMVLEMFVTRIEDGSGRRLLAVMKDVTERKRAEEALRESEWKYRTLFEASPDAIFVQSPEGRIIDVNPAACRLHNARRDTLIGMNVRDLVPSDQRDTVMRDLERLIAKEVSYLQTYGWTINQHAIPVEIRANRFHYNDQEAILLIVRDVSEQRTLEQEVLRISEEERRRIGQDIHDLLGSHFSGIALITRALVNQRKKGARPVDTEQLEEVVQVAREGAEQARALARGLSPLELDGEGLVPALADLANQAKTIAGLTVTLDTSEHLPSLQDGVAAQLYRIAQEAITNVISHADATHLTLRLHRHDGPLVLTVSDDGQGLPAAARESGGMGLHIMAYRARTIGALLQIDSAPGEGATVTCTLPLAVPRPSGPNG